MKKSVLTMTLLIAGIFVFSLLTTSCGGKKENSIDEGHQDSTKMAYACPMHPEVTGKAGDTCSKCGMKLEAVKADSTKAHVEHEH